jgi:hypothetical protein
MVVNTSPRARLETQLYFEKDTVRCDCFLLNLEGTEVAEPPALIQLTSGRTKYSTLPDWRIGDILILLPTMSFGWNDTQETGRCRVELELYVTCEGREGFLSGMIPLNPDPHNFSLNEKQ